MIKQRRKSKSLAGDSHLSYRPWTYPPRQHKYGSPVFFKLPADSGLFAHQKGAGMVAKGRKAKKPAAQSRAA